METKTTEQNTLQFNNRIDLSALNTAITNIKQEIHKIIIGQDKVVDLLLTSILANGHPLIEGVPGVAKTIMIKLLAKTMSIDFSRIQFTPDLMPSDIIGTSIFNAKTTEFEFKKGPIFSNLILIDEINRAPAKTQSALFEVMEERQITSDGNTYPMTRPFLVFATQNPIEQEGTYRLPEAQLDRFIFKINVGYPSLDEEYQILEAQQIRKSFNKLDNIKPIITFKEINDFQNLIHQVHIEPQLLKYIAKIIAQTRETPFLYLGASPRASLFILQSSKAFAAMNNRDFITPEDIKTMAIPVLEHRVIVTPDKEMEGVTSQQVIQQLLESIEIPR